MQNQNVNGIQYVFATWCTPWEKLEIKSDLKFVFILLNIAINQPANRRRTLSYFHVTGRQKFLGSTLT